MKQEEIKQNVYNFLEKVIYKGWTWEKLTQSEKNRFNDVVHSLLQQNIVVGNERQQQAIISGAFGAFIAGLGYNGFNWRSEGEDNPEF